MAEPTVLGWKKVAKKYCSSNFAFPIYKWVLPASANRQRAATKYISFTPKTNTGFYNALLCCFLPCVLLLIHLPLMIVDLKLKVWRCLQDIRPVDLQGIIVTAQVGSIPVIEEPDIKKLLNQQRRRWSEHKRAQREKQNAAQTQKKQISEDKKLRRLKQLRESEAAKRRHAKEACKGLQKVLVPTNIPDKHGLDPTVLKVWTNNDACVCIIFVNSYWSCMFV